MTLNQKSIGFSSQSRTTIVSSLKSFWSGVFVIMLTNTYTYTHTHRNKVIAISARPYYVVGMDDDNDSHTLFICNKKINITLETNCYLYQRYLYQSYNIHGRFTANCPRMFIMYMADLAELADEQRVKLHSYADDSQIYVHCSPSGVVSVVNNSRDAFQKSAIGCPQIVWS